MVIPTNDAGVRSRDYRTRAMREHADRRVYYYNGPDTVSASHRVRRETVGQVRTPFLIRRRAGFAGW